MNSISSKKVFKITCLILFGLCFCIVSSLNIRQNAYADMRFSGYGESIIPYAAVATEKVTYTSKEETYIETYKAVPIYTQISNLPNSCGATGGAIIVGFYDRYYEDLIPDYVPYYSTGAYKMNDRVYTPKLMGELYTLMRTNVDDVGVNQTDCLNGLKSYVNSHGFNISYTNVLKSNNIINEATYTTAINNNQPTLLFCNKMNLYQVLSNTNDDALTCFTYLGAHVAVAYGLYTIKYYNGNNNFRTDKYLKIATGLAEITTGYLKLESNDWCNNAYIVNVL